MSLIAVACAAGVFAQEMMPPPPPELKQAEFLVGNWEGTEDMFWMGPKMTSKSTNQTSWQLNDRHLISRVSYDMGGSMVHGMFVATYDPDKKMWVGWWFDGGAANAMEMSGNLVGDKLVMISKPVPVPGLSGDQTFRSTWWMNGDKLRFNLDLKTEDKWSPMIDGTYTKAKTEGGQQQGKTKSPN